MKPVDTPVRPATGARLLAVGVRFVTMPTTPADNVQATVSVIECADVQQGGEENGVAIFRILERVCTDR